MTPLREIVVIVRDSESPRRYEFVKWAYGGNKSTSRLTACFQSRLPRGTEENITSTRTVSPERSGKKSGNDAVAWDSAVVCCTLGAHLLYTHLLLATEGSRYSNLWWNIRWPPLWTLGSVDQDPLHDPGATRLHSRSHTINSRLTYAFIWFISKFSFCTNCHAT